MDKHEILNVAIVDMRTIVVWTLTNEILRVGGPAINHWDNSQRTEFIGLYGAAAITGETQCFTFSTQQESRWLSIDFVPALNVFVCVHYRGDDVVTPFTPQQDRILQLLKSDYTTKRIASEMKLSESTIQSHLSAMRASSGCDTNWGMVAKFASRPDT